MSILVYTAITSKRSGAKRAITTKSAPPGVGTYVDTLSSLIPGEILALHAAITTITQAPPGWTFWALIGACVVVFLIGRVTTGKFSVWDLLRVLIPTAAFVVWSMLVEPSVFQANWTTIDDATRQIVGLFLAVAVTLGAALLNWWLADKS